jgi:DNA polymerase III subunit alpha
VLESLVKGGAFDSLVPDPDLSIGARRARLMATIDLACEHGARQQRDRSLGQAQLFGGSSSGDEEPLHALVSPANVAPWTEVQQLAYEKEALGLYWSGHPIDRVAADLNVLGAKTTAQLGAKANGVNGGNGRPGGDVAVGGIIASIRPLKTRKGDRMAVIMLEDPHGCVEVVVFPEAYAKAAGVLETGAMVVVSGKVEVDEETVRMTATEVLPFEAMRQKMSRELAIKLTSPPHGRATFEALADLFAKHQGDRRVILELELRREDHPLRVRAGLAMQVRVQPSPQLASEVERICGPGTVSLR